MGANDHDHDEEVTTDDTVDTDTDVDETEDDADTSQNSDADDGADDDADDADEADDADDDASEDGSDDDGKGNSDKKSSDTADDETEDEDDGAEPELRKPKAGASNAEWAAWRKQEKAKAAVNKKSGDDQNSDDKDDSEDTDDLSPEDAAAIDKRIAKRLEPFQKQAAEQEVEASIATFLTENPDFKPFASKAKRFAMHPSREHIPIKSIFYEVAGDKLMKIGAQRAKAADAKARKTKTGGSNTTTDGKGSKSYADMSLDDFGKELDAVKTAPRK